MKKPKRAKMLSLLARHKMQANACAMQYLKRLRPLLAALRKETSKIVDALPASTSDGVKDNDVKDVLRQARKFGQKLFDAQAEKLARVSVEVARGVGGLWATTDAKELFGINMGDLRKGSATLSRNMKQAISDNVSLIKSIPEEHFDRIEGIITDAFDKGTRHEDIAAAIQEGTDITDRRAAFIARDQMAKATSAANEDRLLTIGVKSYTWLASTDERTRPRHAELDGQEFDFDDPPDTSVDGSGTFNNPGFDYNCRCCAIPKFDDLA